MSAPRIADAAPDRLYQLLPAIYRYRDYYDGEPLRALMGVFQEVFDRIESDIARLGEDWFIETCSPKLIPYIGDLVGLADLGAFTSLAASERVLVGNAIRWRYRKGTVAALPEVAAAATGWHAHVREFRELLAATHHIRASQLSARVADLRNQRELDALGGPFDASARSLSVRPANRTYPIPSDGSVLSHGKYHPLFVGISFWRLKAFLVTFRQLAEVDPAVKGAIATYNMHPFGVHAPLFNQPADHQSGSELSVPVPLRPEALRRELAARRNGSVPPPQVAWFGSNPAVDIRVQWSREDPYLPVLPADLYISSSDGDTSDAPVDNKSCHVLLDPGTGLLSFLNCAKPADVRVRYSYGFSGDIGGGPYQTTEDHDLPSASAWKARVIANWTLAEDDDPTPDFLPFASIDEALDAWLNPAAEETETRPVECFIGISDSAIYHLNRTIELKGQKLTICAWDGQCPTIRGNLHVAGMSGNPTIGGPCPIEGDTEAASLVIEGIWLEGSITVEGRIAVKVCDSTVRTEGAGVPAICAATSRPCAVKLEVIRSITGVIVLPMEGGSSMTVESSILDAVTGPVLVVRESTLFGPVRVSALQDATLSLFTAPVVAIERNLGAVSRCWLAPGSETPARIRCLPEWPAPEFTSRQYGDPGFAQLSVHCPEQFFSWSEDGGELGAFHSLGQHARRDRLDRVLAEFLPFHLEAQIFYET